MKSYKSILKCTHIENTHNSLIQFYLIIKDIHTLRIKIIKDKKDTCLVAVNQDLIFQKIYLFFTIILRLKPQTLAFCASMLPLHRPS